MEKEERTALLTRAIRTYGEPAQIDMAIEEMAELTKALCKVKRVSCAAEAKAALENAVEEMADVQIMLDQLRIIFHRSTEEDEEAKLERLAGRLHTRYIENGMIREAERGRSQ
jgi:NTP pyrophosphatase (non-canonical NTP hydrolase)